MSDGSGRDCIASIDTPKSYHKSRTFYIRQALMEHLDDLEDMYMAQQVLSRVEEGTEEMYPLDDVARDLELDD